MLIYDEINKEYYNVIPVKKVEEVIEELENAIKENAKMELRPVFALSKEEFEKIARCEINILQQLIKENTEEELKMTYYESYLKCNTLEELEKEVNSDIIIAQKLNPDRFKIIKEAAEKVANEKFNTKED